MKQVALIPSGCQTWMSHAVAYGGGRFAYASTLAVYIFRLKDFTLEKMIAGHVKNITALAWSPHDSNLLATSSANSDGLQVLKIWNIETEAEICTFVCGKNFHPTMLQWSGAQAYALHCVANGVLRLWDPKRNVMSSVREFDGTVINCVRQSHSNNNVLAIGCEDGSFHIIDTGARKSNKVKFESPMYDIQWDPLSTNYVLVALKNGEIFMYDTENTQRMATFVKQAVGLRGLAWIPTVPGGFITYNDRSGVLRVFNVSQPNPTGLLKVGNSGISSAQFIPGTAQVILSFKDGTVTVYSVEKKMVDWSNEGGHTETIFGCAFAHHDPNVLATCSYDSTVRVWDVSTRKCLSTLHGATGILYSVDWAPGARRMVVTASSDGTVFVFDADKGTVVAKATFHNKAIYRVSWNKLEPQLLATASEDGFTVVARVDFNKNELSLHRKLQHPRKTFGCDWDPFNKDVLATCCEGGAVYVWDLSQPPASLQPRQLKGHQAKVFNVLWSPLVEGSLLSSSDDCTARVWDTAAGTCTILEGHTNRVRGLSWHHEIPYICVTGSWDSTMRVWDTRSGNCLQVVTDHHADVYGIATHPARPFCFASCSRDSTIRAWSMDDFAALKLKAMLGEPFTAPVAEVMQQGAPPRCCGARSRELESKLRSERDVGRFADVFGFFEAPGGVQQLWALARAELAGGGPAMDANGQDEGGGIKTLARMVHRGHVQMVLGSHARQLESVRHARFRGVGMGKKEETLRKAAEIHLKLGNVEGYCNIMQEIGEWDKAIAASPAVGIEFWKEMLQARATEQSLDPSLLDEVTPLYLATCQPEKLVNMLVAANRLEEAFIVAAVARAGGYSDLSSAPGAGGGGGGGGGGLGSPLGKRALPSLAPLGGALPPVRSPAKAGGGGGAGAAGAPGDEDCTMIRALQAERCLAEGEPVWAAASHLSASDPTQAVAKLFQGNEVDMAWALGRVVGCLADGLVEQVARRCEHAGEWRLALKVLQGVRTPGPAVQACAARFMGSPEQVAAFYDAAGLRSVASYAQSAGEARSTVDEIRYLILGREYTRAADRAVEVLHGLISRPAWDVQEVLGIMRHLECVHADAVPKETRDQVLAYAAYVGGLRAMWAGYTPVVRYLMEHARRLIRSFPSARPFPVPISLISLQELSFMAHVDRAEAMRGLQDIQDSPSTPDHLRGVARARLAAIEALPAARSPHYADATVVPVATSIPSGASRDRPRMSIVSGKQVVGPAHVLEDGMTLISLSEAVMWGRVNVFSPLGTGKKIQV